MKVTIERDRWLYPKPGSDYFGVLANKRGDMCALGWIANAAGVATERMVGKRVVGRISGELPPNIEFMRANGTTSDVVSLNDVRTKETLTRPDREAALTTYCKSIGIELEFVD